MRKESKKKLIAVAAAAAFVLLEAVVSDGGMVKAFAEKTYSMLYTQQTADSVKSVTKKAPAFGEGGIDIGDPGGNISPAPASVSPAPASPEPASPEPASPEPASPEPASPEPASPEPASPEPASPTPASPTPNHPIYIPSWTPQPTVAPTVEPTAEPTVAPTAEPTVAPTAEPTVAPTAEPAAAPTAAPTPNLKPGSKFWHTGSNGVQYEFTVGENQTITLTKLKLDSKERVLTIPDTITYGGKKLKVTGISAGAMKNNKKVIKIVIGKNIIVIGKQAFKGCTNLKSVKLPDGLQIVGAQAFANCKKLKKIVIPDSVSEIGDKAFKNCIRMKSAKIGKKRSDIKTGAIGQDVQAGALKLKVSIGAKCFANCKKLRSVIINSAVSRIGNSAFKNCKKLSSIVVRSTILKKVGKKALVGVSKCEISVPKQKFKPYKKLFKNKGQGKKVFVAKSLK